jgi:hypothetical protein
MMLSGIAAASVWLMQCWQLFGYTCPKANTLPKNIGGRSALTDAAIIVAERNVIIQSFPIDGLN